jgi:hypothetical protein
LRLHNLGTVNSDYRCWRMCQDWPCPTFPVHPRSSPRAFFLSQSPLKSFPVPQILCLVGFSGLVMRFSNCREVVPFRLQDNLLTLPHSIPCKSPPRTLRQPISVSRRDPPKARRQPTSVARRALLGTGPQPSSMARMASPEA